MLRKCSICFAGVLSFLVLLSGCGRIVLTADDLVYLPGHKTIYVAQVERDSPFGVRDGLEERTVTFILNGNTVGHARTDDEGRARMVADADVTSQTKYFAAVVDTPTRTLRVERPIHRWDPDKVVIVVDVDGTMSETDYSSLLIDDVDTESKPYDGAREVLAQLDDQYELLYLTARPRFLLKKTRQWLAQHSFPDAPLVTARSVGELLDQGQVKSQMLQQRKTLWPHLLIGIGDKASDIEAYSGNGMLSLILEPEEDNLAVPNVVLFADWEAIGEFFSTHAGTLGDPDQLMELLERDGVSELTRPGAD